MQVSNLPAFRVKERSGAAEWSVLMERIELPTNSLGNYDSIH